VQVFGCIFLHVCTFNLDCELLAVWGIGWDVKMKDAISDDWMFVLSGRKRRAAPRRRCQRPIVHDLHG
jgi:hypothetical protein